jgi:predicted  nucleic acid-binding Zn-ribbon protein
MNSKQLLQNLLKLQSLETDADELVGLDEKSLEKELAELRLQIPLPVLNHYDRLRDRGKKAIVAVRNQTCGGCHVRVTRATVMNLMHGKDIQFCENCRRYLYLPELMEMEPATPRLQKNSPVKLKNFTELRDAA